MNRVCGLPCSRRTGGPWPPNRARIGNPSTFTISCVKPSNIRVIIRWFGATGYSRRTGSTAGGGDQVSSGAPEDFASALEDQRLVRLYRYWDAKRQGRPYPARRDIDPLDFPYVLGQMMLIDVAYDPLRFRF